MRLRAWAGWMFLLGSLWLGFDGAILCADLPDTGGKVGSADKAENEGDAVEGARPFGEVRAGAHRGEPGEVPRLPETRPASTAGPVGVLEVNAFLEKWRRAWESKDLASYCACYSAGFRREEMDRSRFCADKGSKFKRAGRIRIVIEEIEILPSDGRTRVRFLQSYTADGYRDRGRKTLNLVREGDALRIATEDFRPAGAEQAEGEENRAAEVPGGSTGSAPLPPAGLSLREPPASPAQQPAVMHGMRIRRFGDAEVMEILLEGVASPAISQPVAGNLRVVLLPARSALAYGPELRSGLVEEVALCETGGDHPSLILDFVLASAKVRPGPPVVDERGVRIRLAPAE